MKLNECEKKSLVLLIIGEWLLFIYLCNNKRALLQRLPLKILCLVAACECNSAGTRPEVCDFRGRCLCRSGVRGLQCDSCQPGHHSFPVCEGKVTDYMYVIRQTPDQASFNAFKVLLFQGLKPCLLHQVSKRLFCSLQ